MMLQPLMDLMIPSMDFTMPQHPFFGPQPRDSMMMPPVMEFVIPPIGSMPDQQFPYGPSPMSMDIMPPTMDLMLPMDSMMPPMDFFMDPMMSEAAMYGYEDFPFEDQPVLVGEVTISIVLPVPAEIPMMDPESALMYDIITAEPEMQTWVYEDPAFEVMMPGSPLDEQVTMMMMDMLMPSMDMLMPMPEPSMDMWVAPMTMPSTDPAEQSIIEIIEVIETPPPPMTTDDNKWLQDLLVLKMITESESEARMEEDNFLQDLLVYKMVTESGPPPFGEDMMMDTMMSPLMEIMMPPMEMEFPPMENMFPVDMMWMSEPPLPQQPPINTMGPSPMDLLMPFFIHDAMMQQQQAPQPEQLGAHHPPAWTHNADVEAPMGEKDMGSYTMRVYTDEQQERLGVDEMGKPLDRQSQMPKTQEQWQDAVQQLESADQGFKQQLRQKQTQWEQEQDGEEEELLDDVMFLLGLSSPDWRNGLQQSEQEWNQLKQDLQEQMDEISGWLDLAPPSVHEFNQPGQETGL